MAGDEYRVVPHGQQALGDAGDQIVMVALRKIGAANAACKQNITPKRPCDVGRVKHHMTRRMSGSMANLQGVVTQGNRIGIVQPARGGEGTCWRKTISGGGLRQAQNPELIPRIGSNDGQLQVLCQIGVARRMVHMAVSDPDLLELELEFLHRIQQNVEVSPGSMTAA